MITFHADRCSACGLCVENCHEDSLALVDGALQIDRMLCDACAQCIAICPRQALSWDGIPPVAFDRSLLPSSDQLLELFKERRSIRVFKKTRIERTLLEEIADIGVYAPTHNHVFKVIIIDDPDLIAQLSASILLINNRIYRLIYQNWLVTNPLVTSLTDLLGFGDEFRKARPKLESALRRGSAFSSTPAAIMIVVGNKNVALAEASAQYALANMMYYAQIRGVGTCLWGNAPIFLDKDKTIRRRLGIVKRERIYGALYMGYPGIKFSNKVNGKALPIQWNGQHEEKMTPVAA
jgi:nitroreductase/NAD-dependent dihydropyrimidine dehydrogenase PreA subunit